MHFEIIILLMNAFYQLKYHLNQNLLSKSNKNLIGYRETIDFFVMFNYLKLILNDLQGHTNTTLSLTLNSTKEISPQDGRYKTYSKLKLLDDVNKLKFIGVEQTFSFDPKDFKPINNIFANDRVTVEQYLHKPTETMMAVKFNKISFYKFESESNKKVVEKWKKEIELCKRLPESPNIVHLYGFCLYGEYMMICMEYMDMSIRDLTRRFWMEGVVLGDYGIGAIGVAVINAMNNLKKKRIIHRDIKPHNILINKNGEIKLCDFGISKIMENSYATTAIGTIPYWPPERFKCEGNRDVQYSEKSDVWSLGVTLFEIASPDLSFIDTGARQSLELVDILENINYITSDYIKKTILNSYPNIDKTIIEFIVECLSHVDERPTSEMLLETNFYNKYKSINSVQVKLELDEHQVWDNVIDIVTKNKNTNTIDMELLERLLINTEKEFLSHYEITSKEIRKLLQFFVEILHEYRHLDTNQANENILYKQFIFRIYRYSVRANEKIEVDLELIEELGNIIVSYQKYNLDFLNSIILALGHIIYSRKEEEIFDVLIKTGCIEKIISFIFEDSKIMTESYTKNYDNTVERCINLISNTIDDSKKVAEIVYKNQGQISCALCIRNVFLALELSLKCLYIENLNIDILNVLMLLIDSILIEYKEQILDTILEHIDIIISMLKNHSSEYAIHLIISCLHFIDLLKYPTVLNIKEINTTVLEKLISWKLTEHIGFYELDIADHLQQCLSHQSITVQCYSLWRTVNEICTLPRHYDRIRKYIENNGIEIMNTIIKDKRSSKLAKQLARLNADLMNKWQEDKDIRELIKKAGEIKLNRADAYIIDKEINES